MSNEWRYSAPIVLCQQYSICVFIAIQTNADMFIRALLLHTKHTKM